ncbi:hypothetical protein [Actinoallomurus acanthiterrae]
MDLRATTGRAWSMAVFIQPMNVSAVECQATESIFNGLLPPGLTRIRSSIALKSV